MFKKLLLLLTIIVVGAHAIEEQNIQSVMAQKTKQMTKILKDKSLSMREKEKRCIKIVDPVFSYKTMAKIALGKQWKKLSKAEKETFTKRFEKKMKHSYIDKLKLYKNQKVIVEAPKKVKKNRIKLTTKIIGNNETYKIVNSFFKKKHTNQWYIYDVNLAGVSVMQTYRKQFAAFLKTKSFQALLDSLKI